jgi:hypothetical protein
VRGAQAREERSIVLAELGVFQPMDTRVERLIRGISPDSALAPPRAAC